MTIADVQSHPIPLLPKLPWVIRIKMEPEKAHGHDERDVSTLHLSVGKIAGIIAALCGVAMAVVVPVVWWAATLHTQVTAINTSLDSMKGSVAIAAGVAKDLEREREKVSELKTRVDVLYSRTDHLMAAERAREITRQQNR